MKSEAEKTETRSLSLPREMSGSIEKRIDTLRPFIKSFSGYVQALIALDLREDILGAVPTRGRVLQKPARGGSRSRN